MNRRERLRQIKGLLNGTISRDEIKCGVEIWIQELGKDSFRNIKSEETLTRDDLKRRELRVGSSKMIVMMFAKEKSIL
jgi:hypothetical protein